LVLLLAVGSALFWSYLWGLLGFDERGLAAPVAGRSARRDGRGLMLSYFALRASALSPALVEARLQSLTARIRPHFLFNSLNAVISLIRLEPRRAEAALEELAELFRALMRDHAGTGALWLRRSRCAGSI
jgi:two-component system sensor histidine kinase AlgZ